MRDFRYKSRVGERLARILSERGYASERSPGAINTRLVCEVVNRQALGRRMTVNMLKGYIYEGKTLSLEMAAMIAKALEFPLAELAYDDRPRPRPKRQVRGVLDEIDPLI